MVSSQFISCESTGLDDHGGIYRDSWDDGENRYLCCILPSYVYLTVYNMLECTELPCVCVWGGGSGYYYLREGVKHVVSRILPSVASFCSHLSADEVIDTFQVDVGC